MASNQSGFFAQIFLTFSKLTNLQWLRARQIFWMENFKSVFQQIIKTRNAAQLKVQLNQRSLIILISVMLVIKIIPDSVALFHRQLFRVLCVKVEKSFAARELRIMMSLTVMVMMMTLLIFIN